MSSNWLLIGLMMLRVRVQGVSGATVRLEIFLPLW